MARPQPTKKVSDPRRRQAEQSGRRGERLAAWWLRLKGWTILDRRVRTPAGEVDLIARRGSLVAFVNMGITPRHGIEVPYVKRSHYLRAVFEG